MVRDEFEALRDDERLAALRETGLLGTGAEESFDRIARLATRLTGTPLGMINLIAGDTQFAKACVAPEHWPENRELPLSDSFCKYAVASREPLLIEDATADTRVASTRAVTVHGLRSYAGIPLITSDGHALGTLCVADFAPRHWTEPEQETLRDLGETVVAEIELRRAVRQTEAAETLAQIAEQERRAKTTLLESTSEGIYGIDRKGCCTFLNKAGAVMLGYEPDECLGKNMHRLIHHSYADGSPYPETECPIFNAFRAGRSIRMDDEVLWRKDGTSFVAYYTASPIRQNDLVEGAVVTFSDITERKREEDSQRFLNEASKTLAASSVDYIATLKSLVRVSVPAIGDWASLYIVHEDGEPERVEIAHSDPAKETIAQQLAAYSTHPAEGNPIYDVLKGADPVLLSEIPDELIAQVAEDDEHLRILRALGMRSAIVVPLTARGRTLGALTIVSAESERRFTERDLRIAQEFANRAALAVDNARLLHESQRANRTKAEFLATISHELRTPLNAVTGYTALMREGIPEPLPEKSLEYVERIELSAQHLKHLIEEILTFTRLETGKETIRVEPVDLAGLLAEIGAVYEPIAQDHGLRFAVERPGEPVTLETDPRKLRQVLDNLLDNAFKFTTAGEVALVAERTEGAVRFTVRDTGVGIEAEDQAVIFEPFRQLEQSSTRIVGGTGLGLTVTERLVGLLGGTLSLESTPGKGSSFTVVIPDQAAREDGEGLARG
jgi:PAS domain S-box-containing protein